MMAKQRYFKKYFRVILRSHIYIFVFIIFRRSIYTVFKPEFHKKIEARQKNKL